MIIKELYVDHFLEHDDLTLADLSDQLNVIRVPSPRESEFLHSFLPSMLYGACGDETVSSVAGSALVQFGPKLVELLRIADGKMAGLHVLDEQGEVTDCPLDGWLAGLSMQTYLSVFTDRLILTERLKQWRTAGLIQAFGNASSAPAPPDDTHASALSAELRKLEHHLQQLTQQRTEILVQLTSLQDARQDYLNARAAVRDAEQQVDDVDKKLERVRQQIEPAELALQLMKPWQRQAKLTSRIKELRSLRVRPKDLTRLQRAERQLAECRAKLRELRDQGDKQPTVEPVVNAEAQLLLAQREEVLRRVLRAEQLEQEIHDLSHTEQTDRESVVEAVKQLRDAASRLREARLRFRAANERARQMAQGVRPEVSFSSATDETNVESVEELRERIKQLKAETHQLLKRRLLPPPIILLLGGVFATGAMSLMASLLLDLRGFDTSAGAIGVTAMLAAALLKVSFERPPDRKLRAHRQRIQQLLKEVEQRDLTGRTPSGEKPLDRPRIVVPAPEESQADSTNVSPHLRQELEEAYQHWVALLGQYDLDADVSPRDAVVEARRRYAEQSSIRPNDPSTMHIELEEHRRWLERYRESVASKLEFDRRWLEDLSWEQLFQQLADAGRVAPKGAADQSHDRPSPQQIGEAQRQIKELKRSRDRILDRAGAEDVDDLQAKIERKGELSNLEAEFHRVQQRVDRELSGVAYAADVKRLLEGARSDAELKKQRSRKQGDLKRLNAKLQELQKELDDARGTVRRMSDDRGEIDLRLQLNTIDEQLVEATEQVRVVQIGHELAGQQRQQRPVASEPSVVLDDASRLLQACRQVPCHLLYDADRQQFLYVDDSETVTSVRELARHDAELVVNCLQLALVRHLAHEKGIRLPVILTDDSLGYPAQHALQIGKLLCEAIDQGSQSFLFTCHESVSDLFSQLGVPTLVVQRTDDADVLPARSLDDEDHIDDDSIVDATIDGDFIRFDPEETDWIPVEYRVVETHDPRVGRPSDSPSDNDSIWPSGLPDSDASRENDGFSARLDEVRRSSVNASKTYRIDRPHNDLSIRHQPRRRTSITASDDEFPEWWPD